MTDQDKIKSYTHSVIDQGEDHLKGMLHEAEGRLKQGHERVTKWASDVDKQAHENPWPVVTGVGVGCLLLGIILGKSKG